MKPVRAVVRVPGDKSISHRALLFSALAGGTSVITGLLDAEDVGRTLMAVTQLGADVRRGAGGVVVRGATWRRTGTIDCGNSGTTARLLLGALAPRAEATLVGDASLSRRPMARVLTPLRQMGAAVSEMQTLPLMVVPAALQGITWSATVASAQVKSAILLAGLGAEGETVYIEPVPTRNHTERMLRAMGAPISEQGPKISIKAGPLHGLSIEVPADPSSAAFWFVAAAITDGDVTVPDVCLNPTRTGVLDVLRQMGATVDLEARDGAEPLGSVRVRAQGLRGVTIRGPLIPRLVDELPILAIAAAFAEGETIIADAQELRVKESDRVRAMVEGLLAIGVEVEERPDGMRIVGGGARGGVVRSFGDHRVAMSFRIASLRVPVDVDDTRCIATSYPGFEATLASLC